MWLQGEAEGTCPSAGADGPLLLCPQLLNLTCPSPLSRFSVGRLPASEQVPSAWGLVGLRGWKPEGLRHRSEEVGAGPDIGRNHPRGGRRGGPQGTGLLTRARRLSPRGKTTLFDGEPECHELEIIAD